MHETQMTYKSLVLGKQDWEADLEVDFSALRVQLQEGASVIPSQPSGMESLEVSKREGNWIYL